ncbi:alanine racemase C-terminal domain-containing protein [Halothiobacillus sp. 15-55-196]|uniref:alanine racemase C-terminal domain-containing protein n=1 Tax=Halothiobacillus sp. 15-55-196 TaxID=1970382 RepID=UPI0025B8012A|nr:alanine racemase C-terminal domain-containing protein [Halothiobacillus sp. 15-55-196]
MVGFLAIIAHHASRDFGLLQLVATLVEAPNYGQLTRLIGRVSMDMLTVGLAHTPRAVVGSRVELWSDRVPVNEVASRAGTIAYELLCHVKRARFEYSGQSHYSGEEYEADSDVKCTGRDRSLFAGDYRRHDAVHFGANSVACRWHAG